VVEVVEVIEQRVMSTMVFQEVQVVLLQMQVQKEVEILHQ
tara:strand:+ start:68 stop:187 length:120 start_codon:yes stop_codon:yes gene_type:complete